jgi:hypothetical protein
MLFVWSICCPLTFLFAMKNKGSSTEFLMTFSWGICQFLDYVYFPRIYVSSNFIGLFMSTSWTLIEDDLINCGRRQAKIHVNLAHIMIVHNSLQIVCCFYNRVIWLLPFCIVYELSVALICGYHIHTCMLTDTHTELQTHRETHRVITMISQAV